jgi:alpha-mannosidase
VISGVKGAEDGRGIIVRLYNTSSEETAARLVFRKQPVWAGPVDALEDPAPGEAGICDGAVIVKLGGCRVGAVRILFE